MPNKNQQNRSLPVRDLLSHLPMKIDLKIGLNHASCIALNNRGILICGPSNSGKSSLALAFIGLGGVLVADDQTILSLNNNKIIATSPDVLKGLIEARYVAILTVKYQKQTTVDLVIDLGIAETSRLPKQRKIYIKNKALDLIFGKNIKNLHFIVYQWLKMKQHY